MKIENAQYIKKTPDKDEIGSIQATIDGEQMGVPICVGNRHYDEIMRQVSDKDIKLKIKEAD